MTREEILALEAGPEMDALVAEKVMGWSIGAWTDIRHRLKRHPDGSLQRNKPHGNRWSPSTSIADAWEVVEKVDLFTAQQKLPGFYGPEWLVLCAGYVGNSWAVTGSRQEHPVCAPTAPLAICKAALLAQLEET